MRAIWVSDVLRVAQDVSMYRYSWEPIQAILDPSTSSPCQPLLPVKGSLVGLQWHPSGCYNVVVIGATVALSLPRRAHGHRWLLCMTCTGVLKLSKTPLSIPLPDWL